MSQLKIKNGNNWESITAGGVGVPSGGTTGQVLRKSSNTDYATEWGTIVNDYFEEVSGTFSCSDTQQATITQTLHVPNDFTIVSVSLLFGNASYINIGIESVTRTSLLGYAIRNKGTGTISSTAYTAKIHAVRTSALNIYS